MLIDPFLSRSLRHVPPERTPLAALNLDRGAALRLPAGPAVAEKMGVPALSDEELLAPVPRFAKRLRPQLLASTPLWYYVLCEAGSAAGRHGYDSDRSAGASWPRCWSAC